MANLWQDYLISDVRSVIVNMLSVLARIRLSESCKFNWKLYRPCPYPDETSIREAVKDSNEDADVVWFAIKNDVLVLDRLSFSKRLSGFRTFATNRFKDAEGGLFDMVVRTGHHENVKSLLRQRWRTTTHSLYIAILGNDFTLAQLLFTYKAKITAFHMRAALKLARIDFIEWFLRQGLMFPDDAFEYVLQTDNFSFIKAIHALGALPLTEQTFKLACYHCTHVEILEWLLEKECPHDTLMSHVAIHYNASEAVQQWVSQHFPCSQVELEEVEREIEEIH